MAKTSRQGDGFHGGWQVVPGLDLDFEKDTLAVEKAGQEGPEGEVKQRPGEHRPGGIIPPGLSQDIPLLAEEEAIDQGADGCRASPVPMYKMPKATAPIWAPTYANSGFMPSQTKGWTRIPPVMEVEEPVKGAQRNQGPAGTIDHVVTGPGVFVEGDTRPHAAPTKMPRHPATSSPKSVVCRRAYCEASSR